MNKKDALEILHEYTKTDSLRKHAYAVEAAMRTYARKYNEDEELWGSIGLIHDFDYEMYPDQHPMKGDEILATKVEGIDIIISGHTHTKLITPIIISDTIIVQAGEYGMHVGVLDVYYKDGMSQFRRYNLIEINDRIKKDERIQKKIESIVKNKS